MSSQVLAGELAAISSESKRKFPDIRAAADKSIQELKSLPSTSEQQIAADLSRRAHFLDPFIQAALSKNVRLANSAIVCLQRLVLIKGLPRSRLQEVLEAFSACTALSLDVQLKILQALPALVQNYSEDLKGDLIASALYVSAVLQNVKIVTVSAVAAATLQQLVVSVFDKVAAEDAAAKQSPIPPFEHLQIEGQSVPVRESAWDAYRVLRDLVLSCEGKKTDYLGLPNFSQAYGLELIYAACNTYPAVFVAHPELIQVLKDLLAPLLIRLLSDKQSFALSLRAMRLLVPLIQRHVQQMPDECEVIIGLLTHLLDPESSPNWKRIMTMEVLRTLYAAPNLVFDLCVLYDADETRKPLVRENVSAFVRLSTEKPALIGLGPQSSIPSRQTFDEDRGGGIDPAALEATGGFVSAYASAPVAEADVPGLSAQWSIPKVPVLELLDKTDAPALPETYIYSLTLECLNSLADNLAKVVLPLTINQEGGSRRKTRTGLSAPDETNGDDSNAQAERPANRPRRAQSYRSSTMPINPLTLEHSSSLPKVTAIAALIDSCWPALLAISSTFLYCALDNDYYRALIRSVQKYTQVAGLLELFTARDAFLTTLGKAAVPPNVIGSLTLNAPASPGPRSPASRTKSMLSVSSALTTQSNETVTGQRKSAAEAPSVLSTRNMLCLRALINLAIALGPTMKDSFGIILGTLQQADLYLDYIRQTNATTILTALGSEIESVAAATKRLLESTSDYPNESFKHIIEPFCRTLDNDIADFDAPDSPSATEKEPSFNDFLNRAAGISAVGNDSSLYAQDRSIILSKLAFLTDVNTARFATYSAEASQWERILTCLMEVSVSQCFPRGMAITAADVICRAAVSLMRGSVRNPEDPDVEVQMLALQSLRRLLDATLEGGVPTREPYSSIFCRTLEAIRAILEVAGETLNVGWDIILDIIDLAIVPAQQRDTRYDDAPAPALRITTTDSGNHSRDASRVAFTVVQLICAEFLQTLSPASILRIMDILHRFASQPHDLNTSLTAVTLFSEMSNFLMRNEAQPELETIAKLQSTSSVESIELYERLRTAYVESRASQWVILLYQLSQVVADSAGEIRNAAFQTLLRTITTHTLDHDAFQLVFKFTLFKCLGDITDRIDPSVKSESSQLEDGAEASAKAVLEGLARYIAQNIETFEGTSQFESIWESLIGLMERLATIESFITSQAVFAAISTILAHVSDSQGDWETATKRVEKLWNAALPSAPLSAASQSHQQDAFLAYISCGSQLLRLRFQHLDAAQTRTVTQNALRCARESALDKYGNDEKAMTKLQVSVMELFKSLRSDVSGAPVVLIEAAAVIVSLPFEEQNENGALKRPSYVAFSKTGMDWLSQLIRERHADESLYTSNAIATSLEALATPIRIKYFWAKDGVPPAPWKKATASALEIIAPVLSQLNDGSFTLDDKARSRIWKAVVDIAGCIVRGDYSPIPLSDKPDRVQAIEDDERMDAEWLMALRALLVPHLGSPSLPSQIRTQYCSALFSASLIHTPRSTSSSDSATPLTAIGSSQNPALEDADPSRREDLAYLCLAELISMSAATPVAFSWHSSSTFASTHEPGTYGAPTSPERINLAQAAVPWLIARFALSIKSYIADQPLRGASKIPISRSQELIWILARMAELRCVPEALDDVITPVDGLSLETARGKGNMHILLLHGLLIQAIGVAGHPRHGDREILSALMKVLS